MEDLMKLDLYELLNISATADEKEVWVKDYAVKFRLFPYL